MSTRFYDTDLTDAAWAWVAPVLPAARVRVGGRAPPTSVPSSTLSFTSCGQAASDRIRIVDVNIAEGSVTILLTVAIIKALPSLVGAILGTIAAIGGQHSPIIGKHFAD
jgi:hypothetical protein